MIAGRFYEICATCGKRGEEYQTITVLCEECGDEVCEHCGRVDFDPPGKGWHTNCRIQTKASW